MEPPLLGRARHAEGLGDHGFELVDVGDVVDEGERLAGVEEADRRSISGREHGGFGQAVEARCCLAEAAIDRVGQIPVSRIVGAPLR